MSPFRPYSLRPGQLLEVEVVQPDGGRALVAVVLDAVPDHAPSGVAEPRVRGAGAGAAGGRVIATAPLPSSVSRTTEHPEPSPRPLAGLGRGHKYRPGNCPSKTRVRKSARSRTCVHRSPSAIAKGSPGVAGPVLPALLAD